MADEYTSAIPAAVGVALVGDPSALESVAEAIADRMGERALIRCETPAEVRELLTEDRVHCVVSDPAHVLDGSLRETVGADDGRLPILVAGSSPATARALEQGADDVIDPGEPAAAVASRVETAARRFYLERDESASADFGRGLLAGADAVVAAIEPDGTVFAVTPAVEPTLGFTAGELEGRPLSRIVHPGDRTAVERARERVENEGIGASVRERVRLQHADGSRYVHALSLSNRLEDPAVEALVVTIGRPSPQPAEAGLEPAVNHLDFPIIFLDERWAVRYANAAATELLGRPSADARGGVLWDLLPDAVVSAFSERLREAARSGERVTFTVSPPISDRSFAVTALALDDGVLVSARPEPDDVMAATDDVPRDAILETLEDGLCVLSASTIEYANAALFEHLSVTTLEGRAFESVVDSALLEAVHERSEGPVRWMEPIEYVHEAAGRPDRQQRDAGRRRFDVFVTPLEGDRTLCLFRPAKRSPTAQFSTLQKAVSAVDDDAPTRRHLRQSAVDAMVEAFALYGAYWLVRDETGFRPGESSTSMAQETERPNPPGRPIGGDDPRVREAFEEGTPTVVEAVWSEPPDDRAVLPDVAVLVPVGDRGLVVAHPDESETIVRSGGPIAAVGLFAAYVQTVFDTLDARLERFDANRERTRAETAFESLTEADAMVDRAFDALLAARTRADVDRALCRALAGFDGVEFVWVGDADLTINAVTPRRTPGDTSYVDSVETPIAADAEPSGRAIYERNPVEIADLAAERTSGNWADTAFERGLRSVLSVPLSFEAVTYGVLSAYAADPNAFDRHHTRAVTRIASLGAFVIASLDVRRALEAGTVTELEVLVDEDTDALTQFAAAIGARVDVAAVVPRNAVGSTIYCTVESLPPVALDGLASDIAGLSTIRRQTRAASDGDRPPASTTLSLTCVGETVAERLAGYGGTLVTTEPRGNRIRLDLELRPDMVRRTLDALEAAFGPLELHARRTSHRSERTRGNSLAAVEERLTDRQRQTLAAAYHGGYFEWPRERTGEEIARTLGVSQPTFNRHFRAAERNLFSLLFEESDETA